MKSWRNSTRSRTPSVTKKSEKSARRRAVRKQQFNKHLLVRDLHPAPSHMRRRPPLSAANDFAPAPFPPMSRGNENDNEPDVENFLTRQPDRLP